ncbi:hypothetical protein Peur_037819 [Populus x canadensis]
MATEEVGTIKKVGDKYRSFLHEDTENTTQWRHGGPPNFDTVNQLFEEGRTKEWPKGSLEEVVQNAIKTWDMEIEHKTRVQDIKTINPDTQWGFFEGPFKGHAPNGEKVEFYGSGVLNVHESMRVEDVEI